MFYDLCLCLWFVFCFGRMWDSVVGAVCLEVLVRVEVLVRERPRALYSEAEPGG